MDKGNSNAFRLAWDIYHGIWLVSAPEAMLTMASRFLSGLPQDIAPASDATLLKDRDTKGSTPAQNEAGVAVIPIHGVMTKYDNCGLPGTAEIAALIDRCASDNKVLAMVLDIDSGGGAANSVPYLTRAIDNFRATGKPILAHCDLVCSAAYWAASHCDAVYLDNPMSEAGSIGAYAVVEDDTAPDPRTGVRRFAVYSRESPEKNLSYRAALAGDMEPLQDELDETVAAFRAAVLSARPGVDRTALNGKTYRAAAAIKAGLADAVRTLDETVEAAFALASVM